MSIKMKAVLEGNILRKAQGQLLIDGFETAGIIHTNIGDITNEMDIIELPDKTNVPSGLSNATTFDVQIQLAHRASLDTYLQWAYMCRDRSNTGVDPAYKRSGTIIYHRLFQGGGENASGAALPNERVRLFGVWVTAYTLPGAEMGSTEDNLLNMTLSCDDSQPLEKGL